MTHEHDFELIASIAEGGLDPDEQAVSEASLASCEACRVDLQLQREALAALRNAPAAAMTAVERAGLRRNIAAQLPPVSSRSKPTVPWFQRLMPAMAAAAALLVVVGIGSVLIDGSDNADTAVQTTAVASDSLRTAQEEELGESTGDAEFDDSAGAPTTTMAATAPAASIVEDYGSISSADLADIAKQLENGNDEGGAVNQPSDLQSLSLEPGLECDEIALAEGTVTAIRRAVVDGDAVEIYRIDNLVNAYSAADCSLIYPFE